MDRPQANDPDARDERAEDEARSTGGREPGAGREGRGAPRHPGSEETGASFAEEMGDPGDLAEFDDLLQSLRDAMRDAEEARHGLAREAEARPGSGRCDEGAEDAETPYVDVGRAEAAGPPRRERRAEEEYPVGEPSEAAGYPDWLTNGLEPDEFNALAEEQLIERFGRLPRRHVYRSFESTRVSAHALRCRVTLSSNGREFVGEAAGPSVPGVRAEIAARATLDALTTAEDGKLVMSLMAARVLRFSDLPLVVVSVYGMSDDEVNRLVGVSVVDNSEELAAILATLQATDRWIAGVLARNK